MQIHTWTVEDAAQTNPAEEYDTWEEKFNTYLSNKLKKMNKTQMCCLSKVMYAY